VSRLLNRRRMAVHVPGFCGFLSTSLTAGAFVALSLTACGSDRPVAVQAKDVQSVPAGDSVDRPPPVPSNHDVAPRLEAAARNHLGDRYGGFWVAGSVMVVAVVGGPSEEDVTVLKPMTEGLPHEFVAVDTSYARLRQVADEISGGPLMDRISLVGVEEPANSIYIGVSAAGAVSEMQDEVAGRYPDITFIVEFSPPAQTVDG
jgi:hypothetical protein